MKKSILSIFFKNSYTGVFIRPHTVTKLRSLGNLALGTDLWLKG